MQPADIKDERYEYGVIDPKGNFYPCHYEGHHYLASKMQREGLIPEDVDEYSFFEENGWLCLTGAALTECEFVFTFHPQKRVYGEKGIEYVHIERMMTPEQVKAILDYKSARNQDTLNFNFEDMSVEDFKKHAANNFQAYTE